ncbi:MAG: hypothetical protein ACTSW4_00460, partial [Candidatus Ranarchaeia archaeon]
WISSSSETQDHEFPYDPDNNDITFGVTARWRRTYASSKNEYFMMRFQLRTDEASGSSGHLYPLIKTDPVNIWVVYYVPGGTSYFYDLAGTTQSCTLTLEIDNDS